MRAFGHPVHPALVHFPVAFWTTGTLCDGMAISGFEWVWPYAWALIAAGTLMAIPAMIAGFVDIATLDARAMPTAIRHMMLMGGAWTAYLVVLIMRTDHWTPSPGVDVTSIVASTAGLCLMVAGGWYGGQLVYHHGAAVQRRAKERTSSKIVS